MANYYVDAAAGNDTTGTGTTGAPWKTMGKAATIAAAGDIVYGGGTELLTTTVQFTNAGTIVGGYIQYIACTIAGSAWTPSIGAWIINGNSFSGSGLLIVAKDFLSFYGLEIKNMTAYGVQQGTGYSRGVKFLNCSIHNCGYQGINGNGAYAINWIIDRCKIYSNGGHAICDIAGFHITNSESYSNNGFGISSYLGYSPTTVKNCIVRNNVNSGITGPCDVYDSVIDNNPIGIIQNNAFADTPINVIRGNCITNCSIAGISCDTASCIATENENYFFNNNADISVGAGSRIDSLGGSLLAQVSTPYKNPGAGDYSRNTTIGLYNVDKTMPVGVTHYGVTAGLPPVASGGGGGSVIGSSIIKGIN